jgi:hypothetical protein
MPVDRWHLLRRLWSHKGLLSLAGHDEFAFGMEFELKSLLYYFFPLFLLFVPVLVYWRSFAS